MSCAVRTAIWRCDLCEAETSVTFERCSGCSAPRFPPAEVTPVLRQAYEFYRANRQPADDDTFRRAVECLQASTEYQIGNPAFEQAARDLAELRGRLAGR